MGLVPEHACKDDGWVSKGMPGSGLTIDVMFEAHIFLDLRPELNPYLAFAVG